MIDHCICCDSPKLIRNFTHKKFGVRVLHNAVHYHYDLCQSCGHFWVSNPLNDESLRKYYEFSETLRKNSTDKIELAVFSEVADQISTHIDLHSCKVLEIGCDTGQFLDYLCDKFSSRTYFDEYSERAREVIQRKERHADAGAEKDVVFDVIVMRHVLEHVVDPVEWLGKRASQLDVNGVIFVEVPSWTCLDCHTDLLNFEHLQQFTAASLCAALDQAGLIPLTVLQTRTDGYHTTPNWVLRACVRHNAWQIATNRSEQLQALLAQHYDRLYNGVRLVRRSEPRARIALYGASWIAQDILLNDALKPDEIIGILDGDERKTGTDFYGSHVYGIRDLHALAPDIIIILSSYEVEIEESLEESGFTGRIVKLSDLMKKSYS